MEISFRIKIGSILRSAALRACLGLLLVPGLLAADDGAFDRETARELYSGIRHTDDVLSSPRRMVINCLRIDTRTPGLKFYSSPRREEWIEGRFETNRQTVRNFVRTARRADKKLLVAVNADGFSPWPAPFDREEPTDIAGLAVSDGTVVSRSSGSPSFVVSRTGEVQIQTEQEPSGTVRQSVHSAGIRKYSPGTWSVVGTRVVNSTDRSISVLSLVFGADERSRQFGRRLWVPPRAVRTAWIPFQAGGLRSRADQHLSIRALLVDRSGEPSSDVLLGGDSSEQTGEILLRPSVTSDRGLPAA